MNRIFLFHGNLTLLESTEKCWLEQDLNLHLWDTGLTVNLLSYQVHRVWRQVFIELKCMRYSHNNLMLIHDRMYSVSIPHVSQNHLQKYTWTVTEIFFFMIIWHCQSQLQKCWLEWDLNSHLQDTGPPLYLLSYWVHRDWRWVFIQLKCKRYSHL